MTLGLGIDTSFDDTAVAIVENGVDIRSNLTVSQFADHEEFGGVIPERASRLHIQMMLPLLDSHQPPSSLRSINLAQRSSSRPVVSSMSMTAFTTSLITRVSKN